MGGLCLNFDIALAFQGDVSVRSRRTLRKDTDGDGEEAHRNNWRGRMRGLRIKAQKMMQSTPFYLAFPIC
ncbi:MAG: hypothetical protein UBAL2_86920229a [Leptospirillum rubarum]|nr:MAG: hypothetical protein UBAL2_86920229a [Leptospirillum rubarum]